MASALVVALVVANVASFALYGIDKRRAGRGAWRISEATLIASAAVCGTVGAWFGVYAFRHKTRKPSFLLKLAAATLADVAVVAVLVVTLR